MSEKLVIFDCDGTLVDSQHLIVAAMTSAFEGVGHPVPARADILSIVGLSLPFAIETLMPGAPRDQVLAVSDGYKSAFGVLRLDPANAEPLYPGIEPLVRGLARRNDVLLGIATGKSRRGVDRVLAHFDLAGAFTTIHTADDHESKPHPDMVERAMANTDVTPQRTIMIGDTTFDIEMGRSAGAHTIGVSWGYHDVSELRRFGANRIAGTSDALRAAIEDLFGIMDA